MPRQPRPRQPREQGAPDQSDDIAAFVEQGRSDGYVRRSELDALGERAGMDSADLDAIATGLLDSNVEVVAGAEAWAMDESSYGPGVQLPMSKVPVWIRRA